MFESNTPVKIDISLVPENFHPIVKQVVKKNGTLYSSKPSKACGEAKYVWRMLAFYLSPNRKHQCIPMSADFDLEIYDENGSWDANRAFARSKELDIIVDAVISTIPYDQRLGFKRWDKTFSVYNRGV